MVKKLTPLFSKISLLALTLLVIYSSCSRQKNTVISRNYHKLTGRDNYYFNGREKVKAGAAQLALSHVDQYDRLLKIFRYADEQKAKAVYPDMDEAIKKASIVIQRHSMIFSGEEKNRWVRESYLLIGKAQFYKHDYWAAIETFQFVASSYNKDIIRFDALLWLTQCYLELGKTPDAEYLLDFLKNDKAFPWKEKRGEYYAISANFYIQKNNFEKAAEELKNAVASTKKKQDRIRYMFILGQLYQKIGNCQEAYVLFDQVAKRNAQYEMEFNARINRARCFDINNGSQDIKQQLTKMLKDEKNKEYLDQIYYALATIAQKENQEPEAISLYKQSTAASTTNTNQKALSYLELAEIFFKKPDYRTAQIYYDSTVTFLSSDHPDYDALFSKKTSLTKLVKNLNIIQDEDSLLALSSLSATERAAKVDQVIQKENEERERLKLMEDSLKSNEKELEELPLNNQAFYPNNPRNQTFTPTGSGWYFYNPSTVSFGQSEFLKRWGTRKLEDNWRRSAKEITIEGEVTETVSPDDSSEVLLAAQRDSIAKLDSEQRKIAYLNAIPTDPEKIKQSNDRVLEAYYNAGLIYKEQLHNNPAAAEDFEQMMKRFPDNKYKLPAYYNLYRTYLSMKDTAKADVYKNILLNDYPDSEYAKLILNPNYYQENLKKTAILQVFYENTFRAFKNGQYQDVIERKANADSLFPPNALSPKFAFLEAMAIGKTRPLPEFEASLKKVISRYPKDTVSTRAQEILDLMGKIASGQYMDSTQNMPQTPEPKPEAPVIPFTFAPDTVHYFILVFPNGTIDGNDLKAKISDYNSQFYAINNLQVTSAFIGTDKQFIMVRSFENKNSSMGYLEGITDNSDVFGDIDIGTINTFLITPDNMILLAQTRNTFAYEEFFLDHYYNNK